MRWVHAEYLLKGVFLGLLTNAALLHPSTSQAGIIFGATAVGIVLGLLLAAIQMLRSGIRPAGKLPAYLLFLVLEHPRQVYAGTLFGTLVGILAVRPAETNPQLLPACLVAGVLVGVGFIALRILQSGWHRFAAALASAIVICAGVYGLVITWPDLLPDANRASFGLCLLLGLPFFYLLTFAGDAEETEVEAAAICAAMAVGVWLLQVTPSMPLAAVLVPLALFYVYTTRVLPGLRVFKHTLRGLGYARADRPVDALVSLRRAVELQPNDRMARAALWDLHRDLDPAKIAAVPGLGRLIDPDLCLERVAGLLAEPPSPTAASEAVHLIDLVETTRPAAASYWRAVAATHAKELNRAAELLDRLLTPNDDPRRQPLLFPAWQLALFAHAELERRVGRPQLALPGRRLEAIAAVERALVVDLKDSAAWALKRTLYTDLSEDDVRRGPGAAIEPAYAEQLGLALLEDRPARAAEYLTIAALAAPADGPRLWSQAAVAAEKAGDAAGATRRREEGRAAGEAFGIKSLAEPARHAYFAIVKRLGDDADARGDLKSAIANYQRYGEYDRSGIETLRTLADLHERSGDAFAALHATERGLVYNAKDPDLLARKDKYLYSITPEQVRAGSDSLRLAVDIDYCVTKARQLLDTRDADADLIDWAKHLTDVAVVLRPGGFASRLIWARVRLRLGDRDEALRILEDVREQKPEKFASSAEEEAWQLANRFLGDLYLNELDRPDLAVDCFQDFRKSSKSGADTLYKLGLAYERLKEPARAAKYFEQVRAFDGHPLASEAGAALGRVRG